MVHKVGFQSGWLAEEGRLAREEFAEKERRTHWDHSTKSESARNSGSNLESKPSLSADCGDNNK